MKSMIVACILLLATSLLAGAQGARTDNEESRMILSLENAWSQAELTHDAHALDSLLGENFVYTDDDGSYMNRSQWLAHVKRGDDHYQQLGNEDCISIWQRGHCDWGIPRKNRAQGQECGAAWSFHRHLDQREWQMEMCGQSIHT